MNVLLFDSQEVSANVLSISDHRYSHVKDVLKLQVGDSMRVGEINGKVGTAEIVELGSAIVLEIKSLNDPPPVKSPIELILALPRPKSLRRIFRATANIGIKSVHIIHAYRVEKSYWSAPALKPEILRATLLEGLSIAKDTVMPEVHLHKLFKPFAQDYAPRLESEKSFVAHPSDISTTIGAIPLTNKPVLVAIGPEGGFTDYEVKLFNEAGFENLSLGSRVLSVETAVPTIETFMRGKIN
ncbi:MAG: 16S rRNA (uracil(1498)-N(3))-methyltransferase [Deltaproteobacteria bacterium]|jgi:16S rRNA (uracil1498-N3)-methyltransferase|nr:16S rRNA (uracil(1498)-N(3))-methyltransferase [Deltaproteobacteria bacterium]